MRGLIFLGVLLLTGSKVSSDETIIVGGTCDTNGAMSAVAEDNKIFYLCFNGIVYFGYCTHDRYFDPNTAECVAPAVEKPESKVDCQDKNYATYTYPEDNSRYYYCFDNHALIVQCPDDHYYNADSQSCVVDSTPVKVVCPPSGNYFIGQSCTSYIFCWNGTPHPQTCPSGFYFHSNTNTCTTTKPAGCDNIGNCTEVGKITFDPNSCRSYLYCNKDKKLVSMNCPSNYYFDRETANCGPTIPKDCSSSLTYPAVPSPVTPEPVYPSLPLPSYPDSKICSNNLNVVIADSVNCNRYFVCINGTPYELFCQKGYYYNLDSGACEEAVPSTCSSENNTTNEVTCPPFAEVLLPDPNNCKNYIICTDGVAANFVCDEDNFFDPVLVACSPLAPASCAAE